MIVKFTKEDGTFRAYMESHPNAVVVVRYGANGSCEVEEQPDTIDGETVAD